MRLSRPKRAMNQGKPAAGRECSAKVSGRKRRAAISSRLRMYRRTAAGWQFTVGACLNHSLRLRRMLLPAVVVGFGLRAVCPVTGVTVNFVFHADLGLILMRKSTLLSVPSVTGVLELMSVSRTKESRL